MKRPIVKYYSQGSVLALEPLIERVTSDFCNHLESRFMSGSVNQECDLGQWIAFCKRLRSPPILCEHSAEPTCIQTHGTSTALLLSASVSDTWTLAGTMTRPSRSRTRRWITSRPLGRCRFWTFSWTRIQ